MFDLNFFKRKYNLEGLEKAKAMGLISEEEMLELQLERLEKKLKELIAKKK
jgi:hypothetical protein